MKTSYIICTASGWYWRAYDVKANEFSDFYTFFDSIEEAEKHIPSALKCRNGDGLLEIKKVYHN